MSLKRLFILYIIGLLILYTYPFSSSISINSYEITFIRADHFVHSLIFIPLYYFLDNLSKKNNPFSKFKVFIFSLFIASLFELIHLFIPYRTFTIMDLVFNLIGATIGFIPVFILYDYCLITLAIYISLASTKLTVYIPG